MYDYLLDHDDHDDISLAESKENWTLYDSTVPEKIRVLKSLIDDMERTDQMMNLRGDMTPEILVSNNIYLKMISVLLIPDGSFSFFL